LELQVRVLEVQVLLELLLGPEQLEPILEPLLVPEHSLAAHLARLRARRVHLELV